MARSMTPELRLMVAPAATYAWLARQPSSAGPLTALRRPLLAAIVIGVAMTMATTGHVTPALALNTTIAWSFVVMLQIAIALPLIAAAARRTVGVARALDLFFAAHAPWSFWMLAAAALPAPLGRPLPLLILLAAIPLVTTVRAIAAFCREVLRLNPRQAALRTALHQAITWTTFVLLYGTAIAIHPRIVGWIGD